MNNLRQSKLLSELVFVFTFLIFPCLFVFGAQIQNYIFLYLCVILFMFVVSSQVRSFLKLIIVFLIFYLSIGLLNISTWRGYITIDTLYLYAWSMFVFLMPFIIFARDHVSVPFQPVHQNNLIMLVIIAHIFITFIGVAFVYVTVGNLFTAPHLRFYIPTSIEYIIKSGLPISAVLPFLRWKRTELLLVLVLLPPILIGSRGTAVIGVLAYLIVLLHKNGERLTLLSFVAKGKYFIYCIGAIAIISILFYLRRGGESGFAAVSTIMDIYFDYDNILVRSILPFYLGFKETIGLSTRIITEEIQNNINPYPLFFADLFTILPGENLAAGQSMSRVFGSLQEGGLTPGLLGGLYVDYGIGCLFVFFFIGLCLAVLHRFSQSSPYFMIIYAQVITQFIHLFHRGFLKPEYITSVLIASFYFMICHRIYFSTSKKNNL